MTFHDMMISFLKIKISTLTNMNTAYFRNRLKYIAI